MRNMGIVVRSTIMLFAIFENRPQTLEEGAFNNQREWAGRMQDLVSQRA